jgi:hypothetical protein
VLQRERLRLTWQELSEAHRRAINRGLAADGGNRPGGLTSPQISVDLSGLSLTSATRRTGPLLRLPSSPQGKASCHASVRQGKDRSGGGARLAAPPSFL